MTFGLLAAALLAAGLGWFWYAWRKYAERRRAESEREALFLADMARARSTAKPVVPATPDPPADPLQAAGARIKEALARGRAAEAIAAFGQHREQRTRLALAPGEWEALGRALLAQGSFLEAAWALHAGAALAGDALAAQKRLVEVAGKAAAAGKPQLALKLYATLLDKYPGSQYAPFVRSSMKQEENKLGKA